MGKKKIEITINQIMEEANTESKKVGRNQTKESRKKKES